MKPKIEKVTGNKRNIFIAIAILLILGWVGYSIFMSFKKSQGAGPMGGPVEVDVIKLASQNVDDFEELPGRVSAYRFAEIRPQVDGIITKRLFTEGSLVKKGQQLYQIDDPQYQANYQIAKADLQKAKANLVAIIAKSERFNKLVRVNAISKQEYDDMVASLAQANAEVAVAKAAMDKARIYLDYTKVFAPIDGWVSKSMVTEGSLVSTNQAEALTTITQLDPVYVDIVRSSGDLTKFQEMIFGQKENSESKEVPIELYLNDGTIYQTQGVLQFSEVNIDPGTGSINLRAIFENPDQILLPGAFVKTRIKISSKDAILIPQKATTRNPDGSLSVWIIGAENKVAPLPVKAVKAIGNQWLISEGLKDGDVIVVEGFQKIAPGAIVVPSFPKDKSDKASAQKSQ
ncbi:MAG: efflux system, rane fusion protein CmeA [Rickettsiaceae bacterium]|jgi:membrane fusion protein (multidrug efflux system)|nr:efflux system, rane fusion protein CmeA [Rickettsiaceae bacterium]